MAGRVGREPDGPQSVLTMAEVSGLEARVTALLAPALRRGRLTRMQFCPVAAPSLLAVSALVLIGGAPLQAAALRAVTPVTLDAPVLHRAAPARPGSRPGSLPAALPASVSPPIDRPIEVASPSPPETFDSPGS